MNADWSIVIVNFNSGPHLVRCLESIDRWAKGASVVVVDNMSSDGSDRAASRAGASVVLHRNRENLGFARAINQGLARSTGEFVLLLNPDCELGPDTMDRLIADVSADPRCAIAGPRILEGDGGIQGSVRGDPTILTGLFGRSTLMTRLFPDSLLAQKNVRFDLARRDDSVSTEVDWVSGACMLARRSALEAVGGLDERYFLYWEDADLCRRLRTRGHTVHYVAAARVIHHNGTSRKQTLATRAFHESAYIYYATHLGRTPLDRAVARVLLAARCRWKLTSHHISSPRSLFSPRRPLSERGGRTQAEIAVEDSFSNSEL